jgi:hypothetical protein
MQGIEGADEGVKATKLFLFGVGIHLQVNFFLQFFFMFLNPDKMDQVKMKR